MTDHGNATITGAKAESKRLLETVVKPTYEGNGESAMAPRVTAATSAPKYALLTTKCKWAETM